MPTANLQFCRCGKCESFCNNVMRTNNPIDETIQFYANHHGRTYQRKFHRLELERIGSCNDPANHPAFDICAWPQDIKGEDELAELANADRHKPMLYCGKCDCRMQLLTTQPNRSPAGTGTVLSRDFAVHCHGQVYVLNLKEAHLCRMMGDHSKGQRPQRLDVCDKHGNQYTHRPAISPDVKAFEGTNVTLSGMVFDPNPNAPQGPLVASLHAECNAAQHQWNIDWILSGTQPQMATFAHYRVELQVSSEAAIHWVTCFTQLTEKSHAYIDFERVNSHEISPRLQVRVAVVNQLNELSEWTVLELPTPYTAPQPAASDSMQQWAIDALQRRGNGGPVTDAMKNLAPSLSIEVLDALHMAPDGTDLRIRQPGINTLVAGYQYWWREDVQRYVRFADGPVATGRQRASWTGGPNSTVLAKLPGPQTEDTQHSRPSRRIILEE